LKTSQEKKSFFLNRTALD